MKDNSIMNQLIRTDIAHKVYKHSILVKASVSLEYEAIKDVEQAVLDNFMRVHFDLPAKAKDEFLGRGIILRAIDGDVEIKLNPSSFQVILGGANYISFNDSLLELAGAGTAFLKEVANIKAIRSAEIRKANALKVRDDEEGKKFTMAELMDDFFSKALLEEGPLKTDLIDETNVGLLKEFTPQAEDKDVKLKIIYGYQKEEDNEWAASIIFDSCAKYSMPFALEEANDIYDRLNKQLFGLFQGCVSERIIKMLEE